MNSITFLLPLFLLIIGTHQSPYWTNKQNISSSNLNFSAYKVENFYFSKSNGTGWSRAKVKNDDTHFVAGTDDWCNAYYGFQIMFDIEYPEGYDVDGKSA